MVYTEITQSEFEYVLSHLGKIGYTWKILEEPNAKEKIYMVSINDIHMKVFSSLVGGVSRAVGADAIRVIGWDIVSDRPVSSSECRVNRTDNWAENLRKRVETVVGKMIDTPKCSICGGSVVDVNGKYGKFKSCLNYRNHGKVVFDNATTNYIDQLNNKITAIKIEMSTCKDNSKMFELTTKLNYLSKDKELLMRK
jgi:hypothetical protein